MKTSLIILDLLTTSKNHIRFGYDLSDVNEQLIVQFTLKTHMYKITFVTKKICLKFTCYMQSAEIALKHCYLCSVVNSSSVTITWVKALTRSLKLELPAITQ